ncbi:MAG: hypothetical protein AAF840_01570 [Bacteroidota bacterium]
MPTHYAPLFQLSFKHDYFPNEDCPVVEVIPSQESAGVMQQLDIRVRTTAFGLEAYYNNTPPPGGQLLQTNQLIRLTFILRTKDVLFHNYTELPLLRQDEGIQYLTNLGSTDATGRFTAGADRVVAGRGPIFTHDLAPPGDPITLNDELGAILHDSSVAEDQSVLQLLDDTGTQCQVNLSTLPCGRYTLRSEDTILADFIRLPANWQTGDLGIFSVYIGTAGEKGNHLLDNGIVTPAKYDLVFTARHTKWRYHLIDRPPSAHEAFELLEVPSNKVVVPATTLPTLRTLPDGTVAKVITVPNSIPLRSRPVHRFTLRMKAHGSPQNPPISIPLPSADANRLGRDAPADATSTKATTFYSDLYIYL